MKKVLSMAAAMVLAALLTACANTAADLDTAVDRAARDWRGNVSTTDDGRVNGTNRTQDDGARDTGRSRRQRRAARPADGKPLTDAMGAGMA